MIQPLIRSSAATSGGGEPLRAPLFRELVERIPEHSRRVVLDLGPARPETVALFSRFRCRMEIADLASALDNLNAASAAGEDLATAAQAALPAERSEPVDVVLGWDLLNYLDRPALSALMEAIALRCRPGALLHFLLAYAQPRMAALPGRFAPLVDGRLLHEPLTTEQRPAPRYSPEDLARCLPDFQVVRAMLLQNGMQEFLYRT
jgi:hypothetical protein